MKNRGTYIDFSTLGTPRSSFARIKGPAWNPSKCAVCFKNKADCWDTGESDNGDTPSGSRPKRERKKS